MNMSGVFFRRTYIALLQRLPVACSHIVKKSEKGMNMKQQILIVEDNELNREMLKEILSDDYKILEAKNGQQALDILESKKKVFH